ncbi:maleylpyruvate isomerase N-terminal domain-containing protein [Nonomuraea sp. KM90]|uniref:maleylpyruvate isomerase N-terminal domain-containing protein n=1 Tax=Nonomuraea sp. KM90 TaxID=3457428 RepID=UPI003FCD2E7E
MSEHDRALAAGVALLERAIDYTLGSLRVVTPAALCRATPCTGWNLQRLLAHMDDSLRTLHEAAAGHIPPTPTHPLRARTGDPSADPWQATPGEAGGPPAGARRITPDPPGSPPMAPWQAAAGPWQGIAGGRHGTTGGRHGTTGGRHGTTGGRHGTTGGRHGTTGGRQGFTGGEPGAAGPRQGFTGGEPGAAGPRQGFTGGEPGAAGPRQGSVGRLGGAAASGVGAGPGRAAGRPPRPPAWAQPSTARGCNPALLVRDGATEVLGRWTAMITDNLVFIDDRHLTGPMVAAVGAIEIAVHGWDVARACGEHRPIPPLLAEELLDLAHLFVTPHDRPTRFAPPVPVAPHAPAQDHLLAYLGRHPDWYLDN